MRWDLGDLVLVFKEETGWKGVGGEQTLRRVYAKRDATPQNWKEKLEVTELPIAITFGSAVRWNPESIMNFEKARVQKKRCATDGWTVLRTDQSSALWEWQNISCPGYQHQHELVRIVMGRWYAWLISYGFRNRTVSPEEKARFIEHLMSAEVVDLASIR